jgi:threonine/homoserine/homoserine lactone efflux protein
MHVEGEQKLISQNYFKTFINGFLFNILNIGVVLFWLVTVISVRKIIQVQMNFAIYRLVILTYLSIDVFKILLAKQFHNKLNDKVANKIRKLVGFILVAFSVFIFLRVLKIQSV